MFPAERRCPEFRRGSQGHARLLDDYQWIQESDCKYVPTFKLDGVFARKTCAARSRRLWLPLNGISGKLALAVRRFTPKLTPTFVEGIRVQLFPEGSRPTPRIRSPRRAR